MTRYLSMGSGPRERRWSPGLVEGPVEARKTGQLDVSKCQRFGLGVLGTLGERGLNMQGREQGDQVGCIV